MEVNHGVAVSDPLGPFLPTTCIPYRKAYTSRRPARFHFVCHPEAVNLDMRRQADMGHYYLICKPR